MKGVCACSSCDDFTRVSIYAAKILKIAEVKCANASIDSFLSRYVNDVERYDSIREREIESAVEDARRR